MKRGLNGRLEVAARTLPLVAPGSFALMSLTELAKAERGNPRLPVSL